MGFRHADDPPSPLGWSRLLDAASFEAQRPETTEELDGWLLRFDPLGFARLASVWPRAWTGDDVPESLRAAVSAYESRGLPPRVMISPAAQPTDLATLLDASGWSIETMVDVMVKRLQPDNLAAATAGLAHVRMHSEITPDFLKAWGRSDSRIAAAPEAGQAAAGRVADAGFFTFVADGQIAGICRTSRTAAGVAVFGVWVDPDVRRQQIASSLMEAVELWAREHHAPRLWLQVETNNDGALALYRGSGFQRVTGYVNYRHGSWTAPGPC